jgi:hypothetical protein
LITSEAPEMLETFRGNPWEFQQTFKTPLKNLPSFVNTIISSGEPIHAGSLTIDQVVFEPRTLIDMLAKYSIPPTYPRGICLTAAGEKEVEELLSTVLSDWIDFLFVPEPQSFAIYADHDEFTTFYARTPAKLNSIAAALTEQGFKAQPLYKRGF